MHYNRWLTHGSTDLPEKPVKLCRLDSCVTRAVARDLCPKHWSRWRVHGDPETVMVPKDGCLIEWCDRPHAARGYCRMHWKRLKKGQDMNARPRYGLTDEELRERARIRSAAHRMVTDAEVIDTYGMNCHLCGEPVDMEAPRTPAKGIGWELGFQREHVVALANGGADTLENTRPSHALCNVKKGIKELETILDMV